MRKVSRLARESKKRGFSFSLTTLIVAAIILLATLVGFWAVSFYSMRDYTAVMSSSTESLQSSTTSSASTTSTQQVTSVTSSLSSNTSSVTSTTTSTVKTTSLESSSISTMSQVSACAPSFQQLASNGSESGQLPFDLSGQFAYDPSGNLIFATGPIYETVFEINAVSNALIGQVNLCSKAAGIAFDSRDNSLYIATERPVAGLYAFNVSLGSVKQIYGAKSDNYSFSLETTAFDSDDGKLFVVYWNYTDTFNSDILVFNVTSTDNPSIIDTISLGPNAPQGVDNILYDPYNDYIYALYFSASADGNAFFSTYVYNAKTDIKISTIRHDEADYALNANNGQLYMSDYGYYYHSGFDENFFTGNDSITVLRGANETGLISVSSSPNSTLQSIAYDSETNRIFIANGTSSYNDSSSLPTSLTTLGLNSGRIENVVNFTQGISGLFVDPADDDLNVATPTGTIVLEDSTVIGETYSSLAYVLGSEFAKGLYWAFYSNGSSLFYASSPDGVNWSPTSAMQSNYTVTAFDGTYFYFSYGNATADSSSIYFRRGLPEANGSIVWSTERDELAYSVPETTNISRSLTPSSISIDSSGDPWIVATEQVITNESSCYGVEFTCTTDYTILLKSSVNNGSFALETGFPYGVGSGNLGQGGGPEATIVSSPILGTGAAELIVCSTSGYLKYWTGNNWSGSNVTFPCTNMAKIISYGNEIDAIYVNGSYLSYPRTSEFESTYDLSTDAVETYPITNSSFPFWGSLFTYNSSVVFFKLNSDDQSFHLYSRSFDASGWTTAYGAYLTTGQDAYSILSFTGLANASVFGFAMPAYSGSQMPAKIGILYLSAVTPTDNPVWKIQFALLTVTDSTNQ